MGFTYWAWAWARNDPTFLLITPTTKGNNIEYNLYT